MVRVRGAVLASVSEEDDRGHRKDAVHGAGGSGEVGARAVPGLQVDGKEQERLGHSLVELAGSGLVRSEELGGLARVETIAGNFVVRDLEDDVHVFPLLERVQLTGGEPAPGVHRLEKLAHGLEVDRPVAAVAKRLEQDLSAVRKRPVRKVVERVSDRPLGLAHCVSLIDWRSP